MSYNEDINWIIINLNDIFDNDFEDNMHMYKNIELINIKNEIDNHDHTSVVNLL